MEYLAAKVLELADNAARDNKTRIIPRRGSPRLSLDSRKACLNPEASPGVLAVFPVVVFLWLELVGGPSCSAPTFHMKFWSDELALYTAVMWEFRLQLAHFQSQSQTFLPLESAELHIRSRIVQKIQFVMMTWKK